jgi:hypothetical protein
LALLEGKPLEGLEPLPRSIELKIKVKGPVDVPDPWTAGMLH